MQEIGSRTNRWIKLARKLGRRRHREETGLCLLEGYRLVDDARQSNAILEAVLVTSDLIESRQGSSLVEALEAEGVRLFRVEETLLHAIADTVSPQGVVALAAIPPEKKFKNQSLILLLDGVSDPGNGGTLLRSAAAAGVELVLFGPGSVDPFNPKVLRAGMGAHFRVDVGRIDSWSELASLREAGVTIRLADGGAEELYDRVDWCIPSALIVGGEARGAGPEAHGNGVGISIPMAAQTESLNAAVAGSVILFEAARQRRNPRMQDPI